MNNDQSESFHDLFIKCDNVLDAQKECLTNHIQKITGYSTEINENGWNNKETIYTAVLNNKKCIIMHKTNDNKYGFFSEDNSCTTFETLYNEYSKKKNQNEQNCIGVLEKHIKDIAHNYTATIVKPGHIEYTADDRPIKLINKFSIWDIEYDKKFYCKKEIFKIFKDIRTGKKKVVVDTIPEGDESQYAGRKLRKSRKKRSRKNRKLKTKRLSIKRNLKNRNRKHRRH